MPPIRETIVGLQPEFESCLNIITTWYHLKALLAERPFIPYVPGGGGGGGSAGSFQMWVEQCLGAGVDIQFGLDALTLTGESGGTQRFGDGEVYTRQGVVRELRRLGADAEFIRAIDFADLAGVVADLEYFRKVAFARDGYYTTEQRALLEGLATIGEVGYTFSNLGSAAIAIAPRTTGRVLSAINEAGRRVARSRAARFFGETLVDLGRAAFQSHLPPPPLPSRPLPYRPAVASAYGAALQGLQGSGTLDPRSFRAAYRGAYQQGAVHRAVSVSHRQTGTSYEVSRTGASVKVKLSMDARSALRSNPTGNFGVRRSAQGALQGAAAGRRDAGVETAARNARNRLVVADRFTQQGARAADREAAQAAARPDLFLTRGTFILAGG